MMDRFKRTSDKWLLTEDGFVLVTAEEYERQRELDRIVRPETEMQGIYVGFPRIPYGSQ